MENKHYYLSVEDTKKYGIIQAAIIGRIKHWCSNNKKKKLKDRFYEEHWWSGFISSKDFSEQIGLPVKTIEKNLSILIKSNIIIKSTFNKKKYDRTSWYRVNPFPPIEETLSPNRGNGNTPIEKMDLLQKGKPIPVNHSINHSENRSSSTTVNPVKKPLNLIEDIFGSK